MCGWESVIPYMELDMHTSWRALSVQRERVQQGFFPLWLFKIFSGEGKDHGTGVRDISTLTVHINAVFFFILQDGFHTHRPMFLV